MTLSPESLATISAVVATTMTFLRASVPSEPSTKQLSNTLTYMLAGFAGKFPGADGLSTFYPNLLNETPGPGRRALILAQINALKQAHQQFRSFNPTEEFFLDTTKLRFAPDYNTDQWHRGTGGLGPFLPQSPVEIGRQRELQRTRQDHAGHLSETMTSAHQHRSLAPSLNISVADLATAVSNNALWHLATIGDNPWSRFMNELADLLYSRMEDLVLQQYIQHLGPTAIHEINLAAYEFFTDVVTEKHVQECMDSVGCVPLPYSRMRTTAQQILSITTPKRVLPQSMLRELPSQAPPPTPPRLSYGVTPSRGNPSRPSSGGHGPNHTNRSQSGAPRSNANNKTKPAGPPPGFAPLWNDTTGYISTNVLLTRIGETSASVLSHLQLPGDECLNFHLRGLCNGTRCGRKHTSTIPVNSAAAAALLSRLQTARAQL